MVSCSGDPLKMLPFHWSVHKTRVFINRAYEKVEESSILFDLKFSQQV